jgi:hypothetical protein
MSDHMNLFSQRIFKEHPIFNWSLQKGDNDFVYVDQSNCTPYSDQPPESGCYSVAFGCPPIRRYFDGCFDILGGSGAVRYSTDSDSWGRDRIPMVVGSNGTTVVHDNTPEFEANLFLTPFGQSDTFVFEFWMRVVGQGRSRIQIIESKNYSNYGLWLKGTVLTFVYGRTFCSYDVQVVDVPIYVSLYTHPTGIGLSVNGESVAFSEFENPEENHSYLEDGGYGQNPPGFDIYFVENNGVFLEVDSPSLFGYAQDAEMSKRRYVWGQGAGDIQSINNNFDGQSAFSNFNASELPGHAAYPLNYRWESGAKDNLVIRQDNLSFRHPQLPVHSFVDSGPVPRTKEDWFISLDESGSDSFGPYESDEGQVFTTFDLVGSFVDDPVSMFLSGTDFGVSITSVFFPGYEVYITPSTVYWSLDRSGTTDESIAISYFFPEVEQQESYDNFILSFKNFDPALNYEIWNMFQQPEGLKVTISNGIIESLGFGSRTQEKYDSYTTDDYNTVGRIWKSSQFGNNWANPSYLWKGSTEFGFFYEDVELRGYWEDYIPYNTLAAVDESGEFDIDYLQFNISHLTNEAGIEAKVEWHDSVGVAPSNIINGLSNWSTYADNNIAIPSKDAAGNPLGSVLRLYLKFETDGYFTTPIQLNKLSLSTYHGDIIKTKGLSIDKHDGNFVYGADSMPFLTLGKDSGFCSDQPFDVLVNNVENVGAIQFFVRIPENATTDATLASFSGSNVTKTGNTLSSSGGTLIVNGEEVDESLGKTVQANEWHCVALVFDNAVDESDGSITMASGYYFDNIGYFLNTSDMVQTMKDVWQAYTMSESLQFTSYQPMELIQNDIAVYPGIAWQQTDIEPL